MNLQKKRIEKGLSQRELAELANISKRTLEHYEAGQLIIENALLETLIKLSSVLDCRIEDIIDDENIRSTIRANGLAKTGVDIEFKRTKAKTWLQEKRRAANMKQYELAALSGVSLDMIRKYETARYNIDKAKYKTLVKLSSAIGCTVEYIIEDEVLKSSLRVSER